MVEPKDDSASSPPATAGTSGEAPASSAPTSPPTPVEEGPTQPLSLADGSWPPTPPTGGASPGGPTFGPGDVVAGRYRVVRFLAQGGMGEVYEVRDQELGEHVALKTIRPEIAGEERALDRFRREIQLARRITHPNVARVFDLGYHRPRAAGAAEGGVAFLTMELLRGETLAARLLRDGRMKEAEALPLVEQMCAALTAAHAAGIVHRDFKSSNVILTPGAEGASGSRVVVTDFGLARTASAGDGTATGSGTIAGTPDYMAPEQVEGGVVTPAADIFALGVVLYEIVTGTRPFHAESPLATAVKRLREPPPPPRSLVSDLDPNWDQTILRCLERRAADRFTSAGDVARTLRGVGAESPRRSRTWAIAGAAVLTLAALAALRLYRGGSRPTGPAAPAVHGAPGSTPAATAPPPVVTPRRAVAVLGFKSLSARPDAAWLSTALSEMLATELAAGETLRTLPGESVARTKMELALPEAGTLSRATLARIRGNLGADVVVLGSYLLIEERAERPIRLDLRAQDAASGETVTAFADAGSEAQLFELVSRVGARLRDALGAGALSTENAGTLKASLPASPDAAKLYAEGLARLRLFDAQGAREPLEKAVAADPRYSLAHAALSQAWSALGYDGRARDEAKRAFDLSAGLPRQERLSVEGRYREATREWDKATEIYKVLAGFFPDDLEHGLRLAQAETAAGKARDAFATVEGLRRLKAPDREDPRLDIAEAEAAQAVADFKRERAAARAAARKARARGARLLLARARLLDSSAARNLGEPERAVALAAEAEGVFRAAGDQGGRAAALHAIGTIRYTQGDLEGARRRYQEALAIGREIGDRRRVASTLNNLALLTSEQGRPAEARRMYEESLAACREIGDRRRVATALGNIAILLHNQGDLAGAERLYEEALTTAREIGDKAGTARYLTTLGALHLARGQLARSKTRYEEALALSREMSDKRAVAYALWGLGELSVAGGDLARARSRHTEGLKLREEIGEKGNVAESRLALAVLAIETGEAASAEALAREAVEEYRREEQVDAEASGREVLARALLARGRTDEAREAIGEAAGLAKRSPNLETRLAVAVTAARIRAAQPRGDVTADVLRSLEDSIAEAKRSGFVGAELMARLAAAEVELRAGRAAPGRTRIEALMADARARGFGLIARRAGELTRAPLRAIIAK